MVNWHPLKPFGTPWKVTTPVWILLVTYANSYSIIPGKVVLKPQRQRWVALPRSHFRRLPVLFWASNRRVITTNCPATTIRRKLAVSNDIFFDVHPELFREDAPILTSIFFRWVGKNYQLGKYWVMSFVFFNGNCGVEKRQMLWGWGSLNGGPPTLIARMNGTFEGSSLNSASSWWFQRFFIFTPTWGNDPIWLIFFRWRLKPPTI